MIRDDVNDFRFMHLETFADVYLMFIRNSKETDRMKIPIKKGCEYIEIVLVTWFAIRVFKTKKLQLGKKKGDMKQFKTTNPKRELNAE